MNNQNHPGVYVPPPLIYVAFFLLSLFMQRVLPLPVAWFHTRTARIAGILFIVLYLSFFIAALSRFFLSKNTLITIRPARSLETSGVYSVTRNPMYLSLVFLYSGLGIFLGNWWTFLLLAFLIAVVQSYVIQKEEQYLRRAFGSDYDRYRKKVRRWI